MCEGTAPGIGHDILIAAKFLIDTDPATKEDYGFLDGFDHSNVLKYFGSASERVHGWKIIISEYCNGTVRIHNKYDVLSIKIQPNVPRTFNLLSGRGVLTSVEQDVVIDLLCIRL